jgi:peptidoglycan L-alanyl-D-glutamate endopeptidase CwlK
MISSRDINDLLPPVAVLCWSFIENCRAAGIEVLITCTYRDEAAQAALYAQGRTSPGPKVTNARPGASFHQYRVAFDFVPLQHGKAAWQESALFKTCGEIAEKTGLEWAGRWRQFQEMAHCQYSGGLSLADFQAGRTLPGGEVVKTV